MKKWLAAGLLTLLALGIYLTIKPRGYPPPRVSRNAAGTRLEFSAGPCNQGVSPYDQSGLGIKEANWTDDRTLKVKAIVSLNCKEDISKGEFEIEGEKIVLKYTSPKCKICAKCLCPHELTYKFTNLEKKNYQFDLVRLY